MDKLSSCSCCLLSLVTHLSALAREHVALITLVVPRAPEWDGSRPVEELLHSCRHLQWVSVFISFGSFDDVHAGSAFLIEGHVPTNHTDGAQRWLNNGFLSVTWCELYAKSLPGSTVALMVLFLRHFKHLVLASSVTNHSFLSKM